MILKCNAEELALIAQEIGAEVVWGHVHCPSLVRVGRQYDVALSHESGFSREGGELARGSGGI